MSFCHKVVVYTSEICEVSAVISLVVSVVFLRHSVFSSFCVCSLGCYLMVFIDLKLSFFPSLGVLHVHIVSCFL